MLFNAGYTNSCPTYELGDNIKYPNGSPIPGVLKLYSEGYISEIGETINSILAPDSSGEYTTQDMVNELSTVADCTQDISDAINQLLGNPITNRISILDMSNLITSRLSGHGKMLDISQHIVQDNLGSSYGQGWFEYFSLDGLSYVYIPTRSLPNIALGIIPSRGNISLHITLQSYDAGACYNTNWTTSFKHILDPWYITDYNQRNGNIASYYNNNYSTVSDIPIKDYPMCMYNPDTTHTHPYVMTYAANNQKFTLQELEDNVKFTDLFDNTTLKALVPESSILGILFYDAGDSSRFTLITSQSGLPVYNTNNNYLSGMEGYYTQSISRYGIANIISLDTSYNAGWGKTVSIEELPNYIVYNTVDIKDQNGNVVLPANCDISFFGW